MAYTLTDAISREIGKKQSQVDQTIKEIESLKLTLQILENGGAPPPAVRKHTVVGRGVTNQVISYLATHPGQAFTAKQLWKSGFKTKNLNSFRASLQTALRRNKLTRTRNDRGEFVFSVTS